jgi:hypothetical protein
MARLSLTLVLLFSATSAAAPAAPESLGRVTVRSFARDAGLGYQHVATLAMSARAGCAVNCGRTWIPSRSTSSSSSRAPPQKPFFASALPPANFALTPAASTARIDDG